MPKSNTGLKASAKNRPEGLPEYTKKEKEEIKLEARRKIKRLNEKIAIAYELRIDSREISQIIERLFEEKRRQIALTNI